MTDDEYRAAEIVASSDDMDDLRRRIAAALAEERRAAPKPRYQLMRATADGYFFVNVHSCGLTREHYAIRRAEFWGKPSARGCPACEGHGDKHDLGVHLDRGETPLVRYAEAGDTPLT